jgi:hypothetical protein
MRCHSTCLGVILSCGLAAVAAPAPAAAQTTGVRAGISLNPDQFYFGGHLETAPLVDRVRFRPNVEIGLGDDVTVVSVNLELVYFFPSRQRWSLYAGAGPALNIIDTARDTEPEGGFNVVIGGAHAGGLFVEFKVGAVGSPDAKFGVGYSF